MQAASTAFGATKPAESTVVVKVLHARIGELTSENDFLESALIKVGLLSSKR